MSPDEVLSALKEKGVKISRKTLLNYEKNIGITSPARGSEGRGKGRYADYPPKVVNEVFAVYHMLKIHQIKQWDLADILKILPYFINNPIEFFKLTEINIDEQNFFQPAKDSIDSIIKNMFMRNLGLVISYWTCSGAGLSIEGNYEISLAVSEDTVDHIYNELTNVKDGSKGIVRFRIFDRTDSMITEIVLNLLTSK